MSSGEKHKLSAQAQSAENSRELRNSHIFKWKIGNILRDPKLNIVLYLCNSSKFDFLYIKGKKIERNPINKDTNPVFRTCIL